MKKTPIVGLTADLIRDAKLFEDQISKTCQCYQLSLVEFHEILRLPNLDNLLLLLFLFDQSNLEISDDNRNDDDGVGGDDNCIKKLLHLKRAINLLAIF